jgi:hypothetical protein
MVHEPRIVWRMLIAAVLCLCAAVATAGLGLWLLTRPRAADPVRQILRAVAPTQLAAAVMLTAGGVVALSAQPETGLLVVVMCVVGAISTVATGCWQSAKVVARREAAAGCAPRLGGDCGGACATCRLSCNSA